jgi:hypothetical protein
MHVWQTKIPLKIRVFLWQILNDKIQSAEQLKKRNWQGQLNANFVGKNYPLTISSFNMLLPNFARVCRDVLSQPAPVGVGPEAV